MNQIRRRLRGALVTAAIVASVAATLTAQGSSIMAVSATVLQECRLTPGRLDFGAYNPVGANASQALDAEATFDVTCTPGAIARVTLNQGLQAAAGQRRMSSSTGRDRLDYDLYQDSARSARWSPSDTVTLTSFGPAPQRVRVYGRVPARQDVAIGRYADSVLITVSF